jgi:hypothetical protein
MTDVPPSGYLPLAGRRVLISGASTGDPSVWREFIDINLLACLGTVRYGLDHRISPADDLIGLHHGAPGDGGHRNLRGGVLSGRAGRPVTMKKD